MVNLGECLVDGFSFRFFLFWFSSPREGGLLGMAEVSCCSLDFNDHLRWLSKMILQMVSTDWFLFALSFWIGEQYMRIQHTRIITLCVIYRK